jgi:hypothetical protein
MIKHKDPTGGTLKIIFLLVRVQAAKGTLL